MYINHNQMAKNVSNTLTSHYSNLATSTQRLSSGLRVNSAADDAAGLAIRELMRADIAALDQGVRNANDAISLIQTADGALGIIDEKLIRMKELAEQAATGTYDSTQRLMIESEYQAMASEITRIANATDFNGIKLLNGNLSGTHDGSKLDSEGSLKVHFGPGNDSAEDYYYIEIDEMTSQALGLGNASTWKDVQNRGTDAFRKSLTDQIKNDETLTDKQRGEMLAKVDKAVEELNAALTNATDYRQAHKLWAPEGDTDGLKGFMEKGKEFAGNSSLMSDYLTAANKATQTGGPTAAADVALEINNAITAAINTDTRDGIKDITAEQFADMWTKVEAAAKDGGVKAGMKTEEIAEMVNGIKTAWDAQVATDLATPVKNYANELAAATGAVTTYLTTDDPNVSGTDQRDAVIALRNKGYAEYANADSDAKPVVGPTDAAEIVGKLQGKLDELWAGTKEKAFTDLTTPTAATLAEQQAVYDEVMNALKDYAKEELGFSDAQWTKANLAASRPTAQTTTIAAWDTLKTTIGTAITAVNNATKGNAGGLPAATLAEEVAVTNEGRAAAKANDELDKFWNGLRDTEKQKLQYAWGQAAIYNLANAEDDREVAGYGINASTFSFNSALGVDDVATGKIDLRDNKMLEKALDDMQAKVGKMDFAGHTIETQEDAQQALNAINDAITQKDKTRAHLGALQNRLENTVSNLTVQSENLQAAESRISDVDVAKEMTNFVRNQILTQSAVAMLSQANSMPQMAMQLIG